MVRKDADDRHVVRAGRWFGVIITVISIAVAPLLAETGGIFNYLQKMNAIYFIPILTVVAVGMLTKRVPAKAAKFALIAGIVLIATGYFLPPFNRIQNVMSEYHFVAIVLVILVAAMLIIGIFSPRETDYVPQDAKATDLTPWAGAKYAGAVLLAAVFVIYAMFADFSSIDRNNVEAPRAPASPVNALTD